MAATENALCNPKPQTVHPTAAQTERLAYIQYGQDQLHNKVQIFPVIHLANTNPVELLSLGCFLLGLSGAHQSKVHP